MNNMNMGEPDNMNNNIGMDTNKIPNNINNNIGMDTNKDPMKTNEEPHVVVPEQKTIGSIIGIIIIVVIIIIGGLYFWGQKISNEEITTEENIQLTEEVIPETVDIESDLDELGTFDIDAELENIDAELGL